MMRLMSPPIEFVTAVPGFPDARRWTLQPIEEGPCAVLESQDVEGLQFVVMSPAGFFPAYEPELDDAAVDALGLTQPEDAAVYVVLTLGDTLEDTTANLLGPIVVNTVDGRAAQVVLHQPGLSTKAPLLAG
jgi:flagellar assembly factor FliW